MAKHQNSYESGVTTAWMNAAIEFMAHPETLVAFVDTMLSSYHKLKDVEAFRNLGGNENFESLQDRLHGMYAVIKLSRPATHPANNANQPADDIERSIVMRALLACEQKKIDDCITLIDRCSATMISAHQKFGKRLKRPVGSVLIAQQLHALRARQP